MDEIKDCGRFIMTKDEVIITNPSPKLTKQLDKIEDNVGDKK